MFPSAAALVAVADAVFRALWSLVPVEAHGELKKKLVAALNTGFVVSVRALLTEIGIS